MQLETLSLLPEQKQHVEKIISGGLYAGGGCSTSCTNMMVNKLLLQVVITTLTILLIQIRTATAQSCGANQCYVAKFGFCFPLSSDLCMSQATPTTQQLAPPEESPLSTEDPTTYAFDWNFTRADDSNLSSKSSATGINIIPWWGWACLVAACLLFCICCNIECGCRSFCPSKKRRGAAHDSVKTEKETMKNHMVVMKLDRSTKDVNDDKSKRPPRTKRESSGSKKKPTISRSNNHRHHNPCPNEWHYRHRYCGLDDLEAQTARTNETVSSSSDSDGSLSSPDSIFVRMIQDEADRLERAVRDRQSNSLVRSERRMERQQRSRSSRRRSKSRNRSITNNGYDSHHRRPRSRSRRRSKSKSRSITNNGYDSSHANSLVRSDVSHQVIDIQRSMERRRSKSRSSRRSKSRNRSTTNNGYDSHHRRSKSRSKQRDNHKRSSSKSKFQSKGSKAKSSSARSTATVGKNSKYLLERKQDQLRKSLPPPPPRRHEVNRRKSVPPPPPAAVRSSYLKARRSSLEALTAAALPVYEVRPDNSDDPPGLRHRIHLTDTNLNRSYKKERMKDMKSSLTGISLDTKALEVPTKTHDGNAGLFQRSRESLDTTVKYENLSGRSLPVSQHASFRRRSKESLDTQINHIEDDTSDNGSGQSSSTESHEILEAADFKKLLVAIKSLKSIGDVLLYKTDEGIVEGRICHVHTDNPLEPYYTIKLPDGTELQTEASRIVNSDTGEDTEEEDIDVDAAIDQMLGFIDEMQEEEHSTTESQPPTASSILDKFRYNPASNILRSNTFRSILSADPVESPEDSPEGSGETSSNSSERGELVDIEAGGKEDTNTSRKYDQEAAAERSLQDDAVVASMPTPKEPIGRRSIHGYLREWSELLGESSAAIVPQRRNAAASDASSTTVLSDKLPEVIEFDIEAQSNNGPHHDSTTSKRSSVSSLSKNSASTESSRSSTSCTSGF